jgi:tetratricopeptide (TPR) repeat protein
VATIALDVEGLERAGKYIRRARPGHPALIDQGHRMDELFGVVNVPTGIWIDEDGMIVRPPEPAFPEQTNALAKVDIPDDRLDPYMREVVAETRKIRAQPRRYVAALRDWAEHGADSAFALSPDIVVERSAPRPVEVSLAVAQFELGQHLYRGGDLDGAVAHFREAHRLQPDNWTYKRQAWSMADRRQGPTDLYEGDWVRDVRAIGAENYYPKLEM